MCFISGISEIKGYICVDCNKWYKYKSNLHRHLRYECGRKASFKCPYCEHTTKQKHSLKKHVLSLHEDKNNEFQHIYENYDLSL